MTYAIDTLDIQNATADEYARFNECRNRMRAEKLPDDPPIPLEELIQGLQNWPTHEDYWVWVAREAAAPTILGFAEVWVPREDNLHLAAFNIEVLTGYRRRGIGRELLARVVEAAQREGRRILMADTLALIPAGEAFMARLGAERGLESHTNQLAIGEIDTDLLDMWRKRARERAAGFELGLWEGPYPEADIEAVVALYGLLNQQPMGDLDVEDFRFTPALLRQQEQNLLARGMERWTLYARETSTGRFAGYTEVFWSPNRPEVVSQGMTGVFPEYRNRGLGRWLKAEMMLKILAGRPQARFVRTGNADSNAPMLKINTEMGFRPFISRCVWQVETERVARYLGGSASPA